MMESKVENSKYNSYYLSFWIGDDNTIDAFCEELNEEPDTINHYEIARNWIRNRLESDNGFFDAAVEEVSGELNYILECIHENAADLSEAEWTESYGEWIHLETVEQVAEEYYGREELIFLIPEWYDWIHECLDDC